MKRKLIVAVVCLIFICFGINTPAHATSVVSIPINNAGFEDPFIEVVDDYTVDTPPGWTTYNPNNLVPEKRTTWTSNNGVGYVGPGTQFYNQLAPEGRNIGYIYLAQKPGSGVAGFEQILDATLEPDTNYTLKVDVGNLAGTFKGLSFAGFPGYRVELLAGDTVLAADHNNLFIKEGEFKTSTVTYTSTAKDLHLGQKLGIRLVNLLQDKFSGLDFDNVRLTAEPTEA
uniref:12-epi-hapalindole U synthase n=1 Tax=Fischerella sp. TAU TaxID=1930928 RepID=A0A1P8VSI6_9CYAN|nr:Chain A, 12-epi-hapalindole U synthase [Fischerella sp. TAU]5Z53_B Chain B, 12-epi-hapalindole U synthase [Fischerella sp. TAU]5Z53_C Chain C, 12-epi-hapalindole U synthase [Fischerella sp. TAU]5Z53_D Chain D, 12-epi-hapalindole U synthase [Fischerella sp. TAU]5ZFJ_A Chain A, acyclase [Mastigocladus laminosus UTEX LB 1931]5ZFJ_B Chain B, acyclase [Mastigocladus laminosus UTEX LB 1931]5ZFJ_C Chain C, acyclase [Mastigocladus laminosus UTEX LB 1931]5ZFJ_D Chain D, acyclase [Mastigocladus lam